MWLQIIDYQIRRCIYNAQTQSVPRTLASVHEKPQSSPFDKLIDNVLVLMRLPFAGTLIPEFSACNTNYLGGVVARVYVVFASRAHTRLMPISVNANVMNLNFQWIRLYREIFDLTQTYPYSVICTVHCARRTAIESKYVPKNRLPYLIIRFSLWPQCTHLTHSGHNRIGLSLVSVKQTEKRKKEKAKWKRK